MLKEVRITCVIQPSYLLTHLIHIIFALLFFVFLSILELCLKKCFHFILVVSEFRIHEVILSGVEVEHLKSEFAFDKNIEHFQILKGMDLFPFIVETEKSFEK